MTSEREITSNTPTLKDKNTSIEPKKAIEELIELVEDLRTRNSELCAKIEELQDEIVHKEKYEKYFEG